jgi:hypothetical protein
MDSFDEVFRLYFIPGTTCQYSVSETSTKERGPAIERGE